MTTMTMKSSLEIAQEAHAPAGGGHRQGDRPGRGRGGPLRAVQGQDQPGRDRPLAGRRTRRSSASRRSRRRRRARARPPRPSALAQALGRLGKRAVRACASRRSGRSSASRAAPRAAATRRSCRWRTSTSTSRATSPPITAAHNLLAAMIDNHLHYGNALGIDPRDVAWRRVLDMNDRALRDIVDRPGRQGQRRAARDRLRHHRRLRGHGDPLPGQRLAGPRGALERDRRSATTRPASRCTAATSARPARWRRCSRRAPSQPGPDARGSPAFVHGGPFAQHRARLQLDPGHAHRRCKLGDFAVTEAGFGFDLGRREVPGHRVPRRRARRRGA